MSGRRCAVATCTMNVTLIKKKNLSITFHTFPKDERIKEWVNRCKRGDKGFNPNNAVICSQHFADEDYEGNLKLSCDVGRRRILNKSAIPRIDMPDISSPAISRKSRNRLKDKKAVVGALLEAKKQKSPEIFVQEDVEEIVIRDVEEIVITDVEEIVITDVEDIASTSKNGAIEVLEKKYALVLAEKEKLKKLVQNMSSKLKENESKQLELESRIMLVADLEKIID